jgi:predicted signal transduction protein with EAL and GGDEF domain
VRKTFEASFHTTGQYTFSSTVSVGVAIFGDELSDLSALLSAADQALYRAKALGRNRAEPSPHWAERATTERATANLIAAAKVLAPRLGPMKGTLRK